MRRSEDMSMVNLKMEIKPIPQDTTKAYSFAMGVTKVETILIDASNPHLEDRLGGFFSTIVDTSTNKVVGIDIVKQHVGTTTSTNRVVERVAVLKLCFIDTCFLIKLLDMDAPPVLLSKFLQLPEISFVGLGMGHCMEALERDYGLKCRNAVDLAEVAAAVKGRKIMKSYGLLDLAYELGVMEWYTMSYPAAAALSEWNAAIISPGQIEALTWSCYLCFRIGNVLFGC